MAKMISHGSLGMKTIVFVWVTIFVVFSYTFTEGRHISREDYLEAKRLLKLYRRPTVKSIQVENGDIFDCVIIDKQLAFEHPALKNHTIRMKPTSVPEWPKDEGSNRTSPYIGLKGVGCPDGSVPIRRIQISDILRSTSVSSFGRKIYTFDHRWAVTQSQGGFLGAAGRMNLWNPTVYGDDQFSISQLWVVNEASHVPLESIEAGWIVFPKKFGDSKTRFFTYWTSDGYEKTGCYNTLCPGFVQVSQRIALGDAFTSISTYNGPQFNVGIIVVKDQPTGDWWLFVETEPVGYWPKNLFHRLFAGAANRVDFGGEVLNPDFQYRLWPQMGNGNFPDINNFDSKSCVTSNMQVFHGDRKWYDYNATQKPYASKPGCYKVIDGGNKPVWKRIINFGGPGGECS